MTTDNKTLAVDVLAVLRQIADGEGDAQVLAMRVRYAVAELIEEAEKIEAFIHRVGMHCKPFSSALARVKGESA
ncbi:hypothetical protein JAK47_01885 [Stenotrophomonas maltophilia]|uniref:hypothetical protein n=1 Tax=Stenotrophomonas maltophilia TaxID=40324 RepID=UPI0021C79188|nr:hypothetical protein [Stenotrophomonas maltophilia]MCU1053296.1 hypothetical protein [Stenotrophomonas maltophilia]